MGDLFSSSNGNFDIKKEHITGTGEYVITAGLTNNGILGKTDLDAKIFDERTITVDMFGNAFYRQFRYKMVTHARVFSLKPKIEVTHLQGLFFVACLHFLDKEFGYDNMCAWDKIKEKEIILPITTDGAIDFAFMEEFIAGVEGEKLGALNIYLTATGLKTYHLTPEEETVIKRFRENNMWGGGGGKNLFTSSRLY